MTSTKIFCEGCEYLHRFEDEEGPWITCKAKKCPHSDKEVKDWYKKQRGISNG